MSVPEANTVSLSARPCVWWLLPLAAAAATAKATSIAQTVRIIGRLAKMARNLRRRPAAKCGRGVTGFSGRS